MAEEEDPEVKTTEEHEPGAATTAEAEGASADSGASEELPTGVIDDAERLTRLARGAVDEDEAAAYREDRDALLEEHGFTARIREADAGDDATLVCYPNEWIEDGTVQIDRIEDVDRGVERPLEGTGDDDWDAVAAENDAIVERVASDYDEPHPSTARALADFASNHYAKPIAELTPAELAEFTDEYFPRNAWPSEEQAAAIDTSLEIVREKIDVESGDSP